MITMSILVSQAYSNPASQIWASVGSVATPASVVGIAGSGSGTFQYALTSGETYNLYNAGYSYPAGAYLATLSIDVSFVSNVFPADGSSNIPLFFSMEYTDGKGAFVSGTQYFWDASQVSIQDSLVTMLLPFNSVGDGTGNISVNVFVACDSPSVTFNFTGYAQSIQFLSPSPDLVASIFA